MNRTVGLLIWLLPFCWSFAFPLPAILAAWVTLGIVAGLNSRTLSEGSESAERLWTVQSFSLCLLLLLYMPLLSLIGSIPEGLLVAGAVVLFAGLGDRLQTIGKPRPAQDPDSPCPARFPFHVPPLSLLALFLPAVWGGFVILCLEISPIDVPDELQPEHGALSAAGFALLVVATWLFFRAQFGAKSSCWAPVRPIAGLLLVVTLVFAGRACLVTAKTLLFTPPDLQGQALVQSRKQALDSAFSLKFPGLENRLRQSSLARDRDRMDLFDWVDFAKRTLSDPTRDMELPRVSAKFLIRGGNTFPEAEPANDEITSSSEAPHAVGLSVDWSVPRIWVLRSDGLLTRIDDSISRLNLEAEVGPFVHLRLDADRRPLALEAGGRLIRSISDSWEVLCPTIDAYWKPIFKRLAVHPTTAEPIALDVFGAFHRHAPGQGWRADDRFVPFSSTKDIGYDIARDITISPADEILMLDSFGSLYRSPLSGREVVGPERETHYWPDSPVGQSISSPFTDSFLIVDRHGGVYLTDQDLTDQWLHHLEPPLFPRSLPREDPDIVDHAFEPNRGWILLLTRGGRILTNYRWADVWVD